MHRILPLLLLMLLLGEEPTCAVAAPPEGRAWLDVVVLRGREPVEATLELRRLGDLRHRSGAWHGVELAALKLGLTPGEPGAPWRAVTGSTEDPARFGGLLRGLHQVIARTDGGSEARVLVEIEADGQHAHTVVRMATSDEVLEGHVLLADGTPFHGQVLVELEPGSPFEEPGLEHAWVRRTDAQGRFRIAGLPCGALWLTALIPGRMRASLGSVLLPRKAPWTGRVPEPGQGPLVEVLALESGRPIAGAEVLCVSEGHVRSSALLSADHAGRVQLPPGSGSVWLMCSGPGRGPAVVFSRALRGRVPPVRLDAEASIAGIVLAPNDTPVPGVRVRLISAGLDRSDLVTWARTGADGRFTVVGLPAVETNLIVSDPAWTGAGPWREHYEGYKPTAVVLEPGATQRTVLRVEPAGSLEGRVVDPGGVGIPGALVASGVHSDLPDATAATDASGRFRLAGLPRSGTQALRITAPGRDAAQVERVPVGTDTLEVTLTPRIERWVEVRATGGAAQAPVSGAWIVLEELPERGPRERFRARTGADGTAWLGPVRRGRFQVTAGAPGRAPSPWVHIAAEEPGPVTVELATRTQTIRGRVLAAPGEALPSELEVRRSDPDEPPLGALTRGGTPVPVREDGAFEVEGLLPGRYVLRASGVADDRLFEGQAHVVAGEGPISIQLREMSRAPPRRWEFRVRAHDGRPVPRATLWVEADAAPGDVRFDEIEVHDGEATYVARDPKVGLLLRVLACDARTQGGRALPYGWVAANALESSQAPIPIELPPERQIHGHVLGPDGQPIAGVRVSADALVDPNADDDGIELARTTLTRADGSFRLGGLAPERDDIRLRLSVPAECAREPPFWPPDEELTALEVRLARAVRGPLRVVDETGVSVPDALVDLVPELHDAHTFHDNVDAVPLFGEQSMAVRAGADGRARFMRLDPRRGYALYVHPPAARPDLEGVYIPAWRPRAEEDTIVLRRVSK